MVSQVENDIKKCIDNNTSFIVEAGAGSGKTWSLVQALSYIIQHKEKQLYKQNRKVACITYTNVAKDEIIERIKANNLVDVKTIHEFLWDIIKPFQKELKRELCNLIQQKMQDKKLKMEKSKNKETVTYARYKKSYERYKDALNLLNKFQGKIEYKEYYNHKKGIVSHSDILQLANIIFCNYSNIYKILEDSYPIIFIDEYQDTDKDIAETILEKILPNTSVLFGFFGDYYQQIYGKTIGKINADKYRLKRISKNENYRCSVEIIELLNKLRSDIQQQRVGMDEHGRCVCYYINDSDINTEKFIQETVYDDLNISKEDELKRLYLVTRSIAKMNGYLGLHDLYDEENKKVEGRLNKKKAQLLKNKDNRECPFANHLYQIEELIELYSEQRIQRLLSKTYFEINSTNDKVELNNLLENLYKLTKNSSIIEIFEYVWKNNLLKQPNKIKMVIDDEILQDDFFHKLIDMKYCQFQKLYYTVKKTSPFSTNHGTKGDEFDSVVCFIDDNDWKSCYNFNNYLSTKDNGKARFDKTKNMFYVVCSRAKHNLAIVILSHLDEIAIGKIKELFGKDNFFICNSKIIKSKKIS